MKCRRAYAIVLTLVVTGCDDSKVPLSPTPSEAAPPVQAFSLSGGVSDTAFRALAGSRVEIVSGPGAGTIASTDEYGHFQMPGVFTGAVTLTASKEGYRSHTLTISSDRFPRVPGEIQAWAGFYLQTGSPPANIAGEYTVMLTADAACPGLSEAARVRTYTATLTPGTRSDLFVATLSDAQFYRWTSSCPSPEQCSWTLNRFSVGTAGDFTGIPMSIVEALGGGAYLLVDGFGRGSIDSTAITASFDGSLVFCPREPTLIDQGTWACVDAGGVQCHSAGHRLVLVRR